MSAICSCGFECRQLFEGAGIEARTPRVPAACFDCGRLFMVTDRPDHHCRRCYGPAIRYWTTEDDKPEEIGLEEVEEEDAPDGDDYFDRLAGPYRCPACHQNTLRFENTGVWD